ncbi:peptidoglycan-binding domain-containing protein [Micromonospora olivasterospora]|uniref:peptidoglycan-binding domain-containing protein n=1 Tax=Micromonospora olivasterospora TaxID=1880 RepID=UPI001FE92DEC|nr:peptidoglycan-binding domain-containing protein [Micromonospora olivasterospora]
MALRQLALGAGGAVPAHPPRLHTKKAVQDLQRLHGLPPNGKVDTSTWCALVGGVVRQSFQAD